MPRDVFLVVTDLHDSERNMSTRIDYRAEINFVYSKLISLIQRYKEEGSVHLLFLGDIFHHSYKNPEKSVESFDTLQYLCESVESAYSVVGNHEITWAASNPFWYMVQSLEDAPSLRNHSKKQLDAKGLCGKLKVVDRLEFGDSEFLFNHYGVRVHSPCVGKISIGLFHQDLVLKDLVVEMERKYGNTTYDYGFEYVDDSMTLEGYQYAFAGHAHLHYGTYVYSNDKTGSKTEVYWLASLGRTNETEVKDNFLERNIPAIIFEDMKFSQVEDNLFELPNRATCVNEKALVKSKEYRKAAKERKNLTMLHFTEDPVENIRKNFDGKPVFVDMVTSYAANTECALEDFVQQRYDETFNN